jgi:hypothetical protein
MASTERFKMHPMIIWQVYAAVVPWRLSALLLLVSERIALEWLGGPIRSCHFAKGCMVSVGTAVDLEECRICVFAVLNFVYIKLANFQLALS